MENFCSLWTELHPGGGRAREESHLYLQFRRSNLLVRLSGAETDGDVDEVILRGTDALGLGLAADDFADGVAICRDDAPETSDTLLGWRCEPVRVLGLRDDGTTTALVGAREAARWLELN